MKEGYGWLKRAIDWLDACAVFIGCLLLFGLMLVVVADVALRYVFNAPLIWSYEVISNFLMPGLFFLSAGHTLRAHGHVSVDILHNYLSTRTRYALEAITSLIVTPIFIFIAWITLLRTLEQIQSGVSLTDGLQLPAWSTTFLMPIGFGLLAVRTLLNAIGYVATLMTGRETLALPPISGTEEIPQ
jgi:TRAP-type C4-dicarboxylate transport system permease small subunit